jgi:hypothetical protein
VYSPTVDQPNTRDFQFLITDRETFCHEEKRDLHHRVEYPERDCVFYRLTNSEPSGRYRLIKHILTNPHRSVVLMHTKLGVYDESLHGKLRLYALLAPRTLRAKARATPVGALKSAVTTCFMPRVKMRIWLRDVAEGFRGDLLGMSGPATAGRT